MAGLIVAAAAGRAAPVRRDVKPSDPDAIHAMAAGSPACKAARCFVNPDVGLTRATKAAGEYEGEDTDVD